MFDSYCTFHFVALLQVILLTSTIVLCWALIINSAQCQDDNLQHTNDSFQDTRVIYSVGLGYPFPFTWIILLGRDPVSYSLTQGYTLCGV